MAIQPIEAGELRLGWRVVQIDCIGIVEVELVAAKGALRARLLLDATARAGADDLVVVARQIGRPLGNSSLAAMPAGTFQGGLSTTEWMRDWSIGVSLPGRPVTPFIDAIG